MFAQGTAQFFFFIFVCRTLFLLLLFLAAHELNKRIRDEIKMRATVPYLYTSCVCVRGELLEWSPHFKYRFVQVVSEREKHNIYMNGNWFVYCQLFSLPLTPAFSLFRSLSRHRSLFPSPWTVSSDRNIIYTFCHQVISPMKGIYYLIWSLIINK